MQFFNVVILAAVTVLAAPAELQERQFDACDGLFDSPQCCGADVLGIISLDCDSPPAVFASPAGFSAVCSAIGQRARCCVLPVLGQGVLCNRPSGVTN